MIQELFGQTLSQFDVLKKGTFIQREEAVIAKCGPRRCECGGSSISFFNHLGMKIDAIQLAPRKSVRTLKDDVAASMVR
jgi:hypothetical protein